MLTPQQLAQKVGRKVLFVGVETYHWQVADFAKAARNARAMGFDTLAAKRAEGIYKWYQTPGHLTLERQAVLSEGCGFLPYGYCYGPRFGEAQIVAEAAILKEMAAQNDNVVCADLEVEWNGQDTAAALMAHQFQGFSGDLIVSTWADPVQQNWQGVLKALGPAVSAWGPQEYTAWLLQQEPQLLAAGIDQARIFPAFDITNTFTVNDPAAMVKLALSRQELSLWIWEYQAAVANSTLIKSLLTLIPALIQQNAPISVTTAPVSLPNRVKTIVYDSYTIVAGDTLSGIGAKLGIQNWYQNLYMQNKAIIEATAQAHGMISSQGGTYIFPGTILKYPASAARSPQQAQ